MVVNLDNTIFWMAASKAVTIASEKRPSRYSSAIWT